MVLLASYRTESQTKLETSRPEGPQCLAVTACSVSRYSGTRVGHSLGLRKVRGGAFQGELREREQVTAGALNYFCYYIQPVPANK